MSQVFQLVGAATMRALDRDTIERLGVPGELLMESAGRAVTEAVLAVRPRDGRVLAVCGAGNNGGDGLVVARQLRALGVDAEAVVLGDPDALRGDAAANLSRARAFGVPVTRFAGSLPEASVILDALFGTGLSRALSGDAAALVGAMRAASERAVVVSVDLPSGVDADTGQVHGVACEADVTVTLGLPKLGLALEPGRSLAGQVVLARIGIADSTGFGIADSGSLGVAAQEGADAELWTPAAAGLHLPERPADGHKGRFGHVLVIAGSEGKSGAAALCAQAAGRAGAGLVTLACPAGLNDILELKCTEAMTVPVPDTAERAFASGAAGRLLALSAERDVVALGPGIGTGEETRKCVQSLVEGIERPLVIDADGLNCLSGRRAGSAAEGAESAPDAALVRGRSAPTLLTPHPGEAAGWLGVSAAEVNADRVAAARRLAERTGAVVLLKGAASVVAAPEGRTLVNPTGGPLLGTGGTGDVLTGLCAGLLAQGMAAFEAAALAAFLHGAAGDRLAERVGGVGAVAGDLLHEIPATAEALREAAREALEAPDPTAELSVRFPRP